MRAGLYLAARYVSRYYLLSFSFSLLSPFISAVFLAAGWAVTVGVDLDKFLYQTVGLSLFMLAQVATSSVVWDLYSLMSGGQLEYLAASPARPLSVLMAFYLVQLAVFGLGFVSASAVVAAVVKGVEYGVFTLVAGLVAAATSLPLVGMSLAFSYLLPLVRTPSPLTNVLNPTIAMFGGMLYPVEILPRAFRLLADLLPFRVWTELAMSVASGIYIPMALWGRLAGYLFYFALGAVLWSLLMTRFKKTGLYHVW